MLRISSKKENLMVFTFQPQNEYELKLNEVNDCLVAQSTDHL